MEQLFCFLIGTIKRKITGIEFKYIEAFYFLIRTIKLPETLKTWLNTTLSCFLV
ncbi:hypothetical protein [Clostridium botulinum]|uniref:hypothetical protein n=1 Tax=Clostridium botulinum TaxID=1491 RepID=UPI003DA4A474